MVTFQTNANHSADWREENELSKPKRLHLAEGDLEYEAARYNSDVSWLTSEL